MLKYPIPKEKRIALTKLYYHICTTPGMPTYIVSSCSDNLQMLTRSKKKLSVEDLRLPWKPVYKILSKDLFLTRRQFEIRCVITIPRMNILLNSIDALAKPLGTWGTLLIPYGVSSILRQSTRCCQHLYP